jgi:glycolate oxidase iron-sulfur subunit
MSTTSADSQPGDGTAVTSGSNPAELWSLVDKTAFRDCVHCGACVAGCPTFLETGSESDGPRGRIQLMQAVVEEQIKLDGAVQKHLDLCTQCRACEASCPFDVKYGQLFWTFRAAADKAGLAVRRTPPFEQRLVPRVFSRPDRLRRWIRPTRFAQRFRLDRILLASGLWRMMPGRWGRLLTLLPRREKRSARLPHVLPAKGKRRARVALFTGCMADALFRQLHWETARVLQENGCEVCVLRSQVCCGALHHQAGHLAEARELIEQNTRAFAANDFDAIVTNFATCGGFLRQYGSFDMSHFGGKDTPKDLEARRRLSARTGDVCEFLDSIGIVPPHGEIPVTATYHDACQLVHAQHVRESPRRLLGKIPGLTLTELPESDVCCGAHGLYSFTQPEMADRLGQRKLANIERTNADIVVTSDLMCLLHISRAARLQKRPLRVVHPIHLLDLSYREKPFRP